MESIMIEVDSKKTPGTTIKVYRPVFDATFEGLMSGLDNPGFCIRCGEEAYGVEPDARRYPCDSCGQRGVYGLEELVLMNAVHFPPEFPAKDRQ